MTIKRIAEFCLATILLLSSGGLTAQAPDVDRQIEDAKRLYHDANFADAVLKLQGTIDRLKLIQDLKARKAHLVDAHLLLALSHFGLDERELARDHLKQVVRLDPQRHLDPHVYAPPLIALFQEARSAVSSETPAIATKTAGATVAPAKKRGSKTIPILLGVGAAGTAAVAVGTRSNGGSSPSATPTPSPAPITPTLGVGEIRLDSVDPPPGSTIKVGLGGVLIRVNASLIYRESGTYWLYSSDGSSPSACLSGGVAVTVVANQPATAVVRLSYPPAEPNPRTCPLPLTTRIITLQLSAVNSGDAAGVRIPAIAFAIPYTLVP